MAKPDSQWYRLDNAGILYSALQREEYSAIYRFSALMTEPVRPAALQNAIDRVLPRFPSFAVRIRRGLFWYYLEPNTAPGPFLKADVANPCQPVRFREDNGWLVRFYYYRNRISLEVFHALSDRPEPLPFSDAAGGVSAADRHKRSGRKRCAGPGGTAPEGGAGGRLRPLCRTPRPGSAADA